MTAPVEKDKEPAFTSITESRRASSRTERRSTLWDQTKDMMGWVSRDEQAKRAVESQRKAQEKLKREMTMSAGDHRIELPDLAARLDTDIDKGLTSEKVKLKHQKEGYNRITPPKKTPKWVKFIQHMTGGFSLLLWAGSILCFIVVGIQEAGRDQNLSLGVVLALVVFVTGCFSFYQEGKSEAVLASFMKLTPTTCLVKRDNSSGFVEMNADQLCRGDIIQLRGGFKVPADTRIISSQGLKVDNSSLTGEPIPLKRVAECTHEDPFETKNMAFYGTNCTQGSGIGIVVQIGDRTAMGIIAKSTLEAPKPETLMKKEIQHFIHYILIVAFVIGVVFAIGAASLGYGAIQTVVFVIGIIVANVPEGLLATVTVALSITAQNMAAKHVLVKNVETIETLGSVTVICSDKTGTLTQNRMTVRHAVYSQKTTAVDHPHLNTPSHSRSRKGSDQVNALKASGLASPPSGFGAYLVVSRRGSSAGELANRLAAAAASQSYGGRRASNAGSIGFYGQHTVMSLPSVPEVPMKREMSPSAPRSPIKRFTAENMPPKPQAQEAAAKPAEEEEKKLATVDLEGIAGGIELADIIEAAKESSESESVSSLTEDIHQTAQLVTSDHQVVDVELVPMSSLDFARPTTHPVSYGNASHDAVAKKYAPGTVSSPLEYDLLVRTCALCNHATFVDKKKNILQRATNGDASESALLKFSASHSDVDKYRADYPQVACIAFNSTNKYMVTVHKQPNGRFLVLLKGAPERVLDRCEVLVGGIPFDSDQRRAIERSNMELAANGERVLAFAQKELDPLTYPPNYVFDAEKVNFPTEGLEFLGLLSLEDPPRPEVPPAVACCQRAGIQVVMVTGDHPLTAKSIAQQVGIIMPDASVTHLAEKDTEAEAVLITGPEVDQMKEDDWAFVLAKKQIVFARTLPTQKQTIVKNFQAAGNVVAVTGDGVNDSPALKAADVGIAMGSGSDVAKDAADMVLADDNFASIVNGVEEGRIIFDNLKKSICYVIQSNIPEIWPFLFQIILGIPLALTTVMILCIDLGTDVWPAIAFAYEQGESDIMARKPRNQKKDSLVDYKLMLYAYAFVGQLQTIGMFIAFFWTLADYGFTMTHIFSVLNGHMWQTTDIDLAENPDLSHEACQLVDIYKGGGRYSGGTYVTTRCSTFDERNEALHVAQSAAFVAIVIAQIGGGITDRSRFLSYWQHQAKKSNRVMSMGKIEMIVMTVVLVYVPGLNAIFGFRPMKANHWWGGIPAAISIFLLDELRKYVVRNYPQSWVAKVAW